jgi:hypothetical protein
MWFAIELKFTESSRKRLETSIEEVWGSTKGTPLVTTAPIHPDALERVLVIPPLFHSLKDLNETMITIVWNCAIPLEHKERWEFLKAVESLGRANETGKMTSSFNGFSLLPAM